MTDQRSAATTDELMRERVDVFGREVVTLVLSLTAADLHGVLDWYKATDGPLPIGLIQFAASARQGYALRLLECTDALTEIHNGGEPDAS